MKAEIEFSYFNYAQVNDHAHLHLVIYDDEGKEILEGELASIDIPKELVHFKVEDGDDTSFALYPEICSALANAKINFKYYWEE
jgi:hypothetical protein